MKSLLFLLSVFISLAYAKGQDELIPQSIDLRTKSLNHKNSEQLAEKYEYYYDYWSEQEIRHGRTSKWNKEGVLIYEANFVDNQLDGLEERFGEEGNLQSSIQWVLGVKEGIEVHYFSSGKEKLVIPYKAGLKEGLEKSYYPNGQLKQVITYQKGKKEGAANYFKKEGSLKKSLKFKNGKKVKTPKEEAKAPKTKEKTHEIRI